MKEGLICKFSACRLQGGKELSIHLRDAKAGRVRTELVEQLASLQVALPPSEREGRRERYQPSLCLCLCLCLCSVVCGAPLPQLQH